jgi:hypothetical protein
MITAHHGKMPFRVRERAFFDVLDPGAKDP